MPVTSIRTLQEASGARRRTALGVLMRSSGVVAMTLAACLSVGLGEAFGKGGTAKPPPVVAPVGTPGAPTQAVAPIAPPALPPIVSNANGFAITGIIQDATVTGGCAAAGSPAGGTVTVNGTVITVPANLIVQFPAATLTWADAVCPSQGGTAPLGLNGTGGTGGAPFPAVEITVHGNIVGGDNVGTGGRQIAGLIYTSSEFVHAGSGFISFIDYTDGSIYVKTQPGNSEARLLINDPKGRFGRPQTTTDVRYSVDDQNPTIKSAFTGYPMCVPRSNDPVTNVAFAPDAAGIPLDPQCPQINRPRVNAAAVNGGCRTFVQAGLINTRLDVPPPVVGQTICNAFVMPAIAGMPGAAGLAGSSIRTATDPDAREQVPFEVGDYIVWSGALVRGVTGRRATTTPDTIWVHAIDSNVAVFTQPRTLPSYIAIGALNVGVDPFPKAVVAAAGVEATPRFVMEASVSDVASVVDGYLVDHPPGAAPSPDTHRWLTPEGMTGTLAFQVSGRAPVATSVQPFGGGITTQFDGPLLGRARIRALNVPAMVVGAPCLPSDPNPANRLGCSVTASPTRYVRAMVRQLCGPDTSLDGTIVGINKRGTAQGVVRIGSAPVDPNGDGIATIPDTAIPCTARANFANGLWTGQYFAPVANFIFPENLQPGQPPVPNNFWQMDFLVNGEGGAGGNSKAGLTPSPW